VQRFHFMKLTRRNSIRRAATVIRQVPANVPIGPPEPGQIPEFPVLENEANLPGMDIYQATTTEVCLSDRKTLVKALTDFSDDPATKKEQLIQGIDLLAMQGVTSTAEISFVYGLSNTEAKSLLAECMLRMEVAGGVSNVKQARGLMLGKLSFLETMLYDDFSKLNTRGEAKIRQLVAKNLLDLFDKKMVLYGLTPKEIESINEVKPNSLVMNRMNDQNATLEMLASIGDRVQQIQENRSRQATGRTIDVEPE